jgi:hypothetical protein
MPDAWLLATRDFCGLESLLKSINDMIDVFEPVFLVIGTT